MTHSVRAIAGARNVDALLVLHEALALDDADAPTAAVPHELAHTPLTLQLDHRATHIGARPPAGSARTHAFLEFAENSFCAEAQDRTGDTWFFSRLR